LDIWYGDGHREPDHAVPATQVTDTVRGHRRADLTQQHPRSGVQTATGEHSGPGGQLQPMAPDVRAKGDAPEGSGRVGGEVVLVVHQVSWGIRRGRGAHPAPRARGASGNPGDVWGMSPV